MMKAVVTFAVALILFVALPQATSNTLTAATFEDKVRSLSDRYSRHLEQLDLKTASPSYGQTDFMAPGLPREKLMLGMYFKDRALTGDQNALKIIQNQAVATAEFLQHDFSQPTFATAQGLFFLNRYLEEFTGHLDSSTIAQYQQILVSRLRDTSRAPETQNRAAVTAARLAYVLNYLQAEHLLLPDQVQEVQKNLRTLTDKAISSSVTPDGWYYEGDNFSVHYHVVMAYNLFVYGQLTSQSYYSDLGAKMYWNIKRLSFANGLIEARLGHRPPGHGAQVYLMLATIGQIIGDPDWHVYADLLDGDRFFTDPAYPDRLEFHRTSNNLSPYFHDDLSTSDVIETSLITPGFSLDRPWIPTGKLSGLRHESYSDDTMSILTTPDWIIVNNKMNHTLSEVRLLPGGEQTSFRSRKY